MSMPNLPEIDPDLTSCHALNMILASIAMEEAALGRIIDAEGDKLKYILYSQKKECGTGPDACEVLAVNESITRLLDSVSQNQMILKSKMERAASALEKLCPPPCPPKPPCPPEPPCPPPYPCPPDNCRDKCSAVFKTERRLLWCAGSALQWSQTPVSGSCACVDPCDRSKINLHTHGAGGRFMVAFAVNVKAKPGCGTDAEVTLQLVDNHRRTNVYTVCGGAEHDKCSTVSLGGIIVDTHCAGLSSLVLKLVSDDSLIVEDSMLSVLEI